jgi:hypothetical protein
MWWARYLIGLGRVENQFCISGLLVEVTTLVYPNRGESQVSSTTTPYYLSLNRDRPKQSSIATVCRDGIM